MMGLSMDGRDVTQIKSAEDLAGRFTGELLSEISQWKQRLAADPQQLENLERAVNRCFARGADMLIAGILATLIIDQGFQSASEKTRREFSRPLQRDVSGPVAFGCSGVSWYGPRRSIARRRKSDSPKPSRHRPV